MQLFLSPYIGTGARKDPFRPLAFELAGCGAIDLRPDARILDGYSLVGCDEELSDKKLIKLAEGKGEVLTAQAHKRLYDSLNLNERGQKASIADVLGDLMTSGVAGIAKPVSKARGVSELWIKGQLLWSDAPTLPPLFGTITDNFNRTEALILPPWVDQRAGGGGAFSLNGTVMTKTGSGDSFVYHNNSGGGWNADQSAQFDYVSTITADDWGPAVRIAGTGVGTDFSGYCYEPAGGGLAKIISSTFTLLAFVTGFTAPSTPKISVVGSTLRGYLSGVEQSGSPTTDSSLTAAGLGPGMFWYEAGGTLDNAVLTGEITAGAAKSLPTPRRMARMSAHFR